MSNLSFPREPARILPAPRIEPTVRSVWRVALAACCASLCGLGLFDHAAQGSDWPQWRGPRRDGVVPPAAIPPVWPEQLKRTWQVDVGLGHASPVVVGETVYQFSREAGDEVLRACRLSDGRLLWRQAYAAPYEMDSAATDHGPGPKSTPAVADARLFTLGMTGLLCCRETGTGRLIWSFDFSKSFSEPGPQFGTATSPLVSHGLCLVHGGGKSGGLFAAFECATGKQKWGRRGVGPGYASPIVVTWEGETQVVTQTHNSCVSLSLEDGHVLWEIPFTTQYEQNSVTPVAWDGKLLLGGYREKTFVVAPRRAGKTWTVPRVWENGEIPLYMSTPVHTGKLLFGMTQRQAGQIFCVSADTGRIAWTTPGRWGENGALLAVGPHILALSTESQLFVYENTAERWEAVRTYHVAETPTWASPALVPGRLLIKDRDRLHCFELPRAR